MPLCRADVLFVSGGGTMLKLKMFVLGTLVTACMTAASAQTGSIQGVVKDNSGAVIQGADVIVRNIETNAHRAAATSSTGVYSVPNLPVGHYEITAKKDSFKAYHLDDIQLTVAQTLGLDITLEPGTVSEEGMGGGRAGRPAGGGGRVG